MNDELMILNFAHPLTDAQKIQVVEMTGKGIGRTLTIPCQLDNERPFHDQINEMMSGIDLSPEQWQTASIVVNPPGYTPGALTLLAELHGRTGYFPPMIRIRPVDSVPPRYEVAEILNLQKVRKDARRKR